MMAGKRAQARELILDRIIELVPEADLEDTKTLAAIFECVTCNDEKSEPFTKVAESVTA